MKFFFFQEHLRILSQGVNYRKQLERVWKFVRKSAIVTAVTSYQDTTVRIWEALEDLFLTLHFNQYGTRYVVIMLWHIVA